MRKEFHKAEEFVKQLIENGNARKITCAKEPYEIYEANFLVKSNGKALSHDFCFVYKNGALIDYSVCKMEREWDYFTSKGYINKRLFDRAVL